jgi:hypothetical protein
MEPRQYERLTPKLKAGYFVKVVAVLFTQGINEMQTLANVVNKSSTHNQRDANHASLTRLKRYFSDYECFGEAIVNNEGHNKKVFFVNRLLLMSPSLCFDTPLF